MNFVFFVPGFFGFANLGDFTYFAHIREVLGEALAARGLHARIVFVGTTPTSSLATRARHLLKTIREHTPDLEQADIHLVGHSSGGLDARLLVSPLSPLAPEAETCASRVRTVVTIASPHYGTPLAEFFESLSGRAILRVLSLVTIYALRTGRVPIPVVLRLAAFFARPGFGASKAETVLDQLYRQLLEDFSLERRAAVEAFFRDVGREQDLIPQLTPASMAIFNRGAPDRPGVRYGSVVTAARKPGLRSAIVAGVDGYAQATHILYRALYSVAALERPSHLANLDRAQAETLEHAFERKLRASDNDGIVPTLSQPWREIVHAARADHLDVCGHFDHPTHVPPHFDWLISGSGFTRSGFERLWESVARFISGPYSA